jgi:hypothetical protein
MTTYSEIYVTTYTGKQVHVFRPQLDEICLEDIAHHLAQQPRFVGACKKPYSVAQHSTILAQLFLKLGKPELAKFALHHDDAEYVLCDVSSQIKYARGMKFYKKTEKALQRKIYEYFGMDYRAVDPDAEIIKECGEPMEVKIMDSILVCNEARDTLLHPPEWSKRGYVPNLKIVPAGYLKAERDFLKMHYKLFGGK